MRITHITKFFTQNICAMYKLLLSKNLDFLKMIKGVKNSHLENDLGLPSIGNYTSGKNYPPIDVLVKLADYFNVTLDELVLHDLKQEANKNTTFLSEPRANYGFDIKLSRMERAVKDLQDEVFKGKKIEMNGKKD